MPSKELIRKIHQLAILGELGDSTIKDFDYLFDQHWSKTPYKIVSMVLTSDGWIEKTLYTKIYGGGSHTTEGMTSSALNFRHYLTHIVALAGLTREEVNELNTVLERKIKNWKRHNEYYRDEKMSGWY